MGLRVADLAGAPGLGLSLVAGAAGAGREVRWVHTSELSDPTPWLDGGELLLTTGMRLNAGSARRRYVRRLHRAGLAGLGFGVGFGFDSVPADIREEADACGFPVLEVPYETPFIAISKAVSAALTAERTREIERSLRRNQRMTAAMAQGAGAADLLDEVAAETGAWLVLFDLRGEPIAAAPDAPPVDPGALWDELAGEPGGVCGPLARLGPGEEWVALPVGSPRREAVLVVGRCGRLGSTERTAARDAANALGLLLASRRAIAEAQRRVAGDVIADAVSGVLQGPALVRRLELLGHPPGARVRAIVVEPGEGVDTDALAAELEDALTVHSPVRVAAVEGHVVALAGAAPEALVPALSRAVAGHAPGARVGVGRECTPEDVRRSYLSARLALRSSPRAQVARADDPTSYGALLEACPRAVVEGFVSGVLGALRGSPVLVETVRAFVEAQGRWEQAARRLGVHRHTLRYRIARAQELLGRDLSSADDRFEVWMALKASEADPAGRGAGAGT